VSDWRITQHTPTDGQKIAIQMAFDRRAADWHPSEWDYTEWDEFSDECHSICHQTFFMSIDTSFLVIRPLDANNL
jgi:hypothetical protein